MKMNKFNPSSNIFHNWNKDMYIATKKEVRYDDYNNEIVVYNKPFYFGRVNYQPLTTKQLEAYMQTYGETENNVVSCLIDYKDKDKFNIFDLTYLYNSIPYTFCRDVVYMENKSYYKHENNVFTLLVEGTDYKVGDAMIYTHNIAFIVNLGNAKSSDVYEIVTHVEKIMKSKYNLDIRREVVVLGSFQ